MFAPASAAVRQALGALAVGVALSSPAHAFPVTLDPGAINLNGSTITADALNATEVSHIAFDAYGNWEEHGYTYITGAESGGSALANTGLHDTYTLYFEFGGTGNQTLGTFSTATMKLYGVNGSSTFSIDAGNQATVDNGSNIAVLLATSDLINGTTGNDNSGAFFADLLASFTRESNQSAFFAGPANFAGPDGHPLQIFGHFYHAPNGVYPTNDGVVLIGGDDTLTFVPEPASLVLLLAGLTGLRWSRRSS